MEIDRRTLLFLNEQASFGPEKLQKPRRRYSTYVTLRNLALLFVQPALAYEKKYPTRPATSSPKKLLLYIFQICLCVCSQCAIFAGYFVPMLTTQIDDNFMPTAMFALKMAIPVNLIFLLTFYGGFHCGLTLWLG